MTQSEKNNSNSENIQSSFPKHMQSMGVFVQHLKYSIIQNTPYFSYLFKDAIAFNLITYQATTPIAYTFAGREYLINEEESILHTAKPNDVLEFFLVNVTTTILLIELPVDKMALGGSDNPRFRVLPDAGWRHKINPSTLSEVFHSFDQNTISVLNKIRTEATILRWSFQQLELLLEDVKIESTTVVKKEIYEKIVLARSILDEDLSKNYSIAELAKEVGTNEQYLKKYFKLYYHKTIQHYITEKKMQYAKNLILEGQWRMADIARMVGYKHATHFTTAFKKYFGFIPNSLRFSFILAVDFFVDSMILLF